MAKTLSQILVAPGLMHTEDDGYGVTPTTVPPNASSHGVIFIDSANPVQPEFNTITIQAQIDSLDTVKEIPTTALYPVAFEVPLQGSASGGDSPPRFRPMFTCSGFGETITTGTDVAYAPVASDSIISALMAFELKTVLHEVNGVFGNLIIRGTPEQGWRVRTEGLGLYKDPFDGGDSPNNTITGRYAGSYNGGPQNWGAPFLSGANRIKLNNGGSDYFPIISSFEFNMGVQMDRVTDLNSGATGGLFALLYGERDPKVTITIAMDVDSTAEILYSKWFEDARNSVDHTIDLVYTDTASQTCTFAATGAQLLRPRLQTIGRYRTVTLEYKLYGSGYSWTFA